MSGSVKYRFSRSPIVWVKLENLHAPSVLPIEIPALIDTGADGSAIPASLCPYLGHSFEKGQSESAVSGVGQGTVRTFTHSTRMTVYSESGDTSEAFEPIDFLCDFIEQDMPFVLLGQRDFLRMFRYAQDGRAGWFSLEQIT